VLTVRKEESSAINGIENILFTTIRKFKGLEASAVILVDVTKETFTTLENLMDFYVGTSRARQELYIVSETITEEDATEIAKTLAGNKPTKAGFNGIKRELGVEVICK